MNAGWLARVIAILLCLAWGVAMFEVFQVTAMLLWMFGLSGWRP